MGIGFGKKEGQRVEISNQGGEKGVSHMSKKNFIIWGNEDGAIEVEKTNTLLKTYAHRCEPERFSRSGVSISYFGVWITIHSIK
jgi:hypothetical protein